MQEVKKIVILGPESTGKSSLCTLLAEHYNTFWCPEYAREYLLAHGTNYTYDDLLEIAKGQLALQEEYVRKVIRQETVDDGPWTRNKDKEVIKEERSTKLQRAITNEQQGTGKKLLFIDTDMHVMKVWCEFVFGKCHPFILDKLAEQKVDLYLLCNIDLPWVIDELREYPEVEPRERLYQIYKDLMLNQQVPWVDIHGDYDQRLSIAINAINHHFFATGV